MLEMSNIIFALNGYKDNTMTDIIITINLIIIGLIMVIAIIYGLYALHSDMQSLDRGIDWEQNEKIRKSIKYMEKSFRKNL